MKYSKHRLFILDHFQHMNSNKHRRLSIALQSHMTGRCQTVKIFVYQRRVNIDPCYPFSGGSNGQGVSGSSRASKVWYQGEVTKESLAQSQQNRECNVREIPMLSMFLQRLHQHHYFPPIRVSKKNRAPQCSAGILTWLTWLLHCRMMKTPQQKHTDNNLVTNQVLINEMEAILWVEFSNQFIYQLLCSCN